jgi:hypothetical protein
VTAENESASSSGWARVPEESGDGVMTYSLASWSSFFDFLETEVFHAAIRPKRAYIWRGQRRSDWSISSSLDRLFQRLGLGSAGAEVLDKYSQEHLRSFTYATQQRDNQQICRETRQGSLRLRDPCNPPAPTQAQLCRRSSAHRFRTKAVR